MSDKFWKNRNVFVTGCTGLLGSWLTKALVERGANVTGLIRDLVPKSNLNWSGFNDKINIVRGNIKGTWNILEACRRNPLVKRIVVASSDKAYGDQEKLPYDENTSLEGRHPYDVSICCSDLLCRAYFETYKLPVCVTRCGNLYGGGDLNFNRIVPETIRFILNNKRPIIRSDGTLIRDYFYIEDAVEAYLLLAEKMEELNIQGEAFNFSNEIQITVLELVNKIIKLMKSNLKPKILNEAINEIKHQYLSAKKAKKILGWRPKYTLEEGLKRTIEWYKEFFKEDRYNKP